MILQMPSHIHDQFCPEGWNDGAEYVAICSDCWTRLCSDEINSSEHGHGVCNGPQKGTFHGQEWRKEMIELLQSSVPLFCYGMKIREMM